MIASLRLIQFQQHAEHVIRELGGGSNKAVDHLVFHYLLSRVDLMTGVVGIKSAVSYSRMALDLSEKRGGGARSEPIVFNSDDVRNSVKRLLGADLFERLSEKGKGNRLMLVFKFDGQFLASHNSVQNEVTDRLPASYQGKTVTNQGTYDDLNGVGYGEVTINSPSFLPSSVKSCSANESGGVFELSDDWKPGQKFMEKVNNTWKPDAAMVTQMKAALMDFVFYWQTKPVRFKQQEWEHKLWRNEIEPIVTGRAAKPVVQPQRVGAAKPARAVYSAKKVIKVPSVLYGKPLQDFGVKHGFRLVNAGESDDTYRQCLIIHVEGLNNQNDREGVR